MSGVWDDEYAAMIRRMQDEHRRRYAEWKDMAHPMRALLPKVRRETADHPIIEAPAKPEAVPLSDLRDTKRRAGAERIREFVK